MKMILATAALALGAALAAGGAMAAPAVAPGQAVPHMGAGDLIKVHGVHRSCERGPAGWHRTPRPGVRYACRPSRPSGLHWSWRRNGPSWAWYHSRDRRWR